MPKFLEQKLKREYAAKGKKGKALDHAVFGTMNAIGAMHGNQITAQGERMQEKHDRDVETHVPPERKTRKQARHTFTESNSYNWRSRENLR
jgi:hypothetical protein